MRAVVFRTEIFKTPRDVKRGELALTEYLRTLFHLNIAYLKDYPETPKLYDTPVRYQVEPKRPLIVIGGERFYGMESWKTIPVVLSDGFGDCEDLACWRAAELFVSGVKARPVWSVRIYPAKNLRLYHIRTQLPDGSIEDPSKRLGMKG